MNLHNDWWACLNHGGLLISPSKITECFPETLNPLPDWQAERLRRALTAFDGSNDSLTGLLDYMLQDLTGLPEQEWQKAQAVDARWSIRSFTGTQIKPRRLWRGANGETLPVFVPEDGASRQFSGRLGVGRSRQLLSRVVEWLRRVQQPLALVTNGRQWRLIHAGQDYDSWCEWDIDLWFEEGQPGAQAMAWRQLLSRESLKATSASANSVLLSAILESRKGQAELSAVLGERVRQAVEELITASHGAIEQAKLTGNIQNYGDLYLAGSRIIMRCIITLFAEARSLLPVDNPIYQQAYSLEGLRQQLDRRAGGRGNERLTQGRSAWPRLVALFNLIYQGSAHEALPVPQYSGGLFEPGDAASQSGVSRALALLESNNNSVSDRQALNILRLLTRTRIRVRQGHKNTWVDAPVDFSALSSEYIGILYEGLLDFELKQADANDPVLFLGIGKQPALTLSQLESMDDKTIKQLFEALSKKEKTGGDDGGSDESEEETDVDMTDSSEDNAEDNSGDDEEPIEDTLEAADETDAELALSADDMARAQRWLEHAAELAGLVKKPKGKKAANSDYEQDRARAAKQLCARLVAPGEFYLVRWGGTRKGAGTFYTRPQLAAPTVRRTLQPLAYLPVRSEINSRSGLEDVVEWAPKTPEQILSLKICDPAMGSGSFLAGALRYLTDALVQSLYHHERIVRHADGAVARLADGNASQGLGDELLPLPQEHEGFEDALRSQLKRHIVERCIYGVDLDPLAVELGRMALWVETMDRDLPFGFLDHKLKVGNSLVGSWFDTFRHYPAMAWEREGGDKDYHKDKPDNLINHYYTDAKGKKRGDVFTAAIKEHRTYVPTQLIATLSGQMLIGEDIVAEVHGELVTVFEELHQLKVFEADKRAVLYREKVLDNPRFHALKARMDLWCALWFWPGDSIEHAPLPANFDQPSEQALAIAIEVAARQRFFHWELEFPDVFTPARAGFDALLGNPPWEIQKPNSKEFFSNTDPLYRAYGKQEALAKHLEYFRQWPQVESDWIAYNAGFKGMSNWAKYAGVPFGDRVTEDKDGKQRHDLNLGGRGQNSFSISAQLHKKWKLQRSRHAGFADANHPFLHQGSADLNTYKMFLELTHSLLRQSGLMGMIVPSGIYSDKGTTALRALFLEHCGWQWLFGFENREGIFDIHRSFKFCSLIVQKGGETLAICASFMRRNVDDWEQAERHVLVYPRERVEEFSPFAKAILEISSEKDLRVLKKIYANGVLLGDQSERGWGIKYATEFHATNDSDLFPPRPRWEAKGFEQTVLGFWKAGDRYALPVYNAKMFSIWDFCSSGWVRGKGRGAVWEDINYPKVLGPEYLMDRDVFLAKAARDGSTRLVFKAISTAVHQRTMIPSLIPDVPTVNACPVLSVKVGQPIEHLQFILASFVIDYTTKFKIGYLNLNYFIIAELSLIPPSKIASHAEVISHLVSSLSYPSELFACYWHEHKRQFGDRSWRHNWAISHHERLRLRCMLDAVAAELFGLHFDEFKWILNQTDLPKESIRDRNYCSQLNQKAFWRIDKDKDAELRHTVLSMIAFHDLQEKGLSTFLAQNNGEGWLIPETLRLADYGLGHDERANEHQPVASRLGPRFHDWQLNEDVERSWAECAAHAELIRRIVPLPDNVATSVADVPEQFTQGVLI